MNGIREFADAEAEFSDAFRRIVIPVGKVYKSAMADDPLINLLAWCKRERERLQMQREMLHSGRFRIFETDESGQRDISNQHIEQIAANIAELDRIIVEAKEV